MPKSTDNSTKSTRSAKEERLHVSFLTSAGGGSEPPAESGPEVALAGRSNAGKSSCLNRLAGHRQLARVSKTPGRTQLLNFFDVAGGGRLVDLPGYGYAKAGRAAQERWQQDVNSYLNYREALCGLVLVIDIRHPFADFDQELMQWACDSELALHILLNKADKLKAGARQATLGEAQKQLDKQLGKQPDRASNAGALATVQCYSALTGLGQIEALTRLKDLLQPSR